MFQPLPTPREMGNWDRLSMDDFGIPGAILMENASRCAFDVLCETYGDVFGAHCLVIAGPGNNGGDAFAMGRYLHDAGAHVLVVHTKPKNAYKREAGLHMRLSERVGTPVVHAPTARRLQAAASRHLDGIDIVVDGLLGTGLLGSLRHDVLELVQAMNMLSRNAFAFAIDIPSGLNGTTGKPSPEAFQADCTATFQAAKLGLMQSEATSFTGALRICSIGIPKKIIQEHPPRHRLATPGLIDLRPVPGSTAHKGTFGHVLIVGGSPGLTGAPFLSAMGALRSGTGLVTVACPESLGREIKHGSPEVMLLPLPGRNWTPEQIDTLQPTLSRFDAVIVGPGLGRERSTRNFLQHFLKLHRPPTVFDADALFFLPDCPAPSSKDVLTPHPLEAARLLGLKEAEQVQADRSGSVISLAQRYGCTSILKGAGSLVTMPGQPVTLFPFAQPILAVGGSGDVLAGATGALCAQGLDAHHAALLATYLHGCAGEHLEHMFPYRGNLARDLADALPAIVPDSADADDAITI